MRQGAPSASRRHRRRSVGQIHVTKDGRDDAPRRRLGVDGTEQLAFAGEADRHRSAGRDREDGAITVGRVGERTIAVVVDDRVGERAEGRDQRAFQALLDLDEVLQQPDRASLVLLQEA